MENFALVQELKLELIREYEQYVETIAGITGASDDDAREAVHRATCRMLTGLRNRPSGNPIIAWRPYILQAAMNALRDERKERKRVIRFSELRREQREQLLAIPDPRPTPEERMEESETRAILWSEVENLSPREAHVLRRWAHGSTFTEIAVALDIAPPTVRVLWMRGIRHLRKRPRVQELAA